MKKFILKMFLGLIFVFINLTSYGASEDTNNIFKAIEKNDFDTVVRIFSSPQEELKPTTLDPKGMSFLHRASIRSPTIAHFLLERGANPYLRTELEGFTALHLACKHGYFSLVKQLVCEKTSPTNEKDSKGNTPLHYCVLGMVIEMSRKEEAEDIKKSDFQQCMRVLLENGADLNLRNSIEFLKSL